MELKKKHKNDITLGYIKGDIDIDTCTELKKWFTGILKRKQKRIILNFSQVNFIDSLGIATLIWFLKGVKKSNGTVLLCNVSPKIRSIFIITKLDRVFKIFDLEKEALSDFGGKGT